MIALQLVDIKDFMNKLLCTDLFDHFLLPEATIHTFVNHTIDGHLNPDFFSPEDEQYDLLQQTSIAPFSMLRPVCYQLIRGNRTPLGFKFVFQLSLENQRRTIERSGCGFLPEDITGMFLHLKFQDQKLLCTTGISYRVFSMNKSLEQEWDRLITVFLKNHKIPYEIL